MGTPRVTLDGHELLTAENAVWSITSGVQPNQQGFRVTNTQAEALARKVGSPITLTIDGAPDYGRAEFKRLYPMPPLATQDPWTRQIAVVDRRWLWPRIHCFGRFNIRRRTGVNPLTDSYDVLGNLIGSVAQIQYAEWSLNAGKPWTGEAILRKIMPLVALDSEWEIREAIPSAQTLPVDSLELDDSFDQALSRVLQFLPGLDVFVDRDGRIVFYNRAHPGSGIRPPAPDSKGTVMTGSGWSVQMVNARIRPTRVNVFISREFEVRLDEVEVSDVPQSLIAGPGLEQIENVIPVTDQILTLADGTKALAGTWLTVDQTLAAWALDPPPAGPGLTALPAPSRADIRKGWMYGFWAYGLAGAVSPNSKWIGRLAAARQHFRQTYRIKRSFMDRIYQISPYRVAILDATTGTRASAQAWSDYTMALSGRAVFDDPKNVLHDVAIRAYANALNQGKLTPLIVRILDAEQGVFQLGFRGDYLGQVESIIPSFMDHVSTADMSGKNGPRWRYEKLLDGNLPQLSKDHGVAVVMTVALGAPNTLDNLERLQVDAAEAEKVLADVDARFLPAEGPEMDIRIGPGILTAKYAWIDTADHKKTVQRAFGIVEETRAGTGWQGPNLDYAWINREECLDVARAIAAATYAGLIDHLQGGHAVLMDPKIEPRGWLDSVSHGIEPDGKLRTSMAFPATAPAVWNFLSLLAPSTRATILRMVQPR